MISVLLDPGLEKSMLALNGIVAMLIGDSALVAAAVRMLRVLRRMAWAPGRV